MKLVKQNFKFKEGEVVGVINDGFYSIYALIGGVLKETYIDNFSTYVTEKFNLIEREEIEKDIQGEVYTLSSALEALDFLDSNWSPPKKQDTILLSTVKEKDIIVIRDTIDDIRYKWVRVGKEEYILIDLYRNTTNLIKYTSLEDFILQWGDKVEVFVCDSVEESVNFLCGR